MDSVYHWVGFVVFWCAAYAFACVAALAALYGLSVVLEKRYGQVSITPLTDAIDDAIEGASSFSWVRR